VSMQPPCLPSYGRCTSMGSSCTGAAVLLLVLRMVCQPPAGLDHLQAIMATTCLPASDMDVVLQALQAMQRCVGSCVGCPKVRQHHLDPNSLGSLQSTCSGKGVAFVLGGGVVCTGDIDRTYGSTCVVWWECSGCCVGAQCTLWLVRALAVRQAVGVGICGACDSGNQWDMLAVLVRIPALPSVGLLLYTRSALC
jgi:hypothetical protein